MENENQKLLSSDCDIGAMLIMLLAMTTLGCLILSIICNGLNYLFAWVIQ